jgi:hypothetical protein
MDKNDYLSRGPSAAECWVVLSGHPGELGLGVKGIREHWKMKMN